MTTFIHLTLVYNKQEKPFQYNTVVTVPNVLDQQKEFPLRKVSYRSSTSHTFSLKMERFDLTLQHPVDAHGQRPVFKYRDAYNTVKQDYDIDCIFGHVKTIHQFKDSHPTHVKSMLQFGIPSDFAITQDNMPDEILLTVRQQDLNRKNPDSIKSFKCYSVSSSGNRSYLSLKNYGNDGHVALGFMESIEINANSDSKKNILKSVCILPELFLTENVEQYFYNLDLEHSDDDDY